MLGLAGATVLLWLGARSLWSAVRARAGTELAVEVVSPGAAFRTSLAATASNPSTIASWAALFTWASTAEVATGFGPTLALLAGVGIGSLTWFTVLSAVAGTLVRRRLTDRAVAVAHGVAGAGLMGFGAVLGYRSLRRG